MRRVICSAWAGVIPAVALSILYLAWQPPSADLAAQTFRADQFTEHGFQVWSNAWYSGFHMPGYSLLYPPLAALTGVRPAGAIAVVAAALLFGLVAHRRYGDRAALAIWLFGFGVAGNLYTGRLTFALGVALGMAAILAADRRRPVFVAVLAALSALASPVAGLFVALAGVVLIALSTPLGRPFRAWPARPVGDSEATDIDRDTGFTALGMALAIPALAVIGVMAIAFPTGGVEPFLANTFELILPACLLLVAILPGDQRALRLGAVVYLALCVLLFVADTPVGGNVTRLGAMLAAPLLALGAWRRRPAWVVLAALVPLVYWQLVAPVRDVAQAVDDPSTEASYYDELLAHLDTAANAGGEPFRVHVTPTRNRWEAVYVAERYPIARGWMRQLESDDFELFEDGGLDAGQYRAWLDERAVAYVAIPRRARQDYLARDEVDLIHSGLPYLTPVFADEDWQLYAVEDPAPLVDAPGTVAALGDQSVELDLPSAGTYRLAVNDSPYWQVTSGDACLGSDEDEALTVTVEDAQQVRIEARFRLAGMAGSGADRC